MEWPPRLRSRSVGIGEVSAVAAPKPLGAGGKYWVCIRALTSAGVAWARFGLRYCPRADSSERASIHHQPAPGARIGRSLSLTASVARRFSSAAPWLPSSEATCSGDPSAAQGGEQPELGAALRLVGVCGSELVLAARSSRAVPPDVAAIAIGAGLGSGCQRSASFDVVVVIGLYDGLPDAGRDRLASDEFEVGPDSDRELARRVGPIFGLEAGEVAAVPQPVVAVE